jgi:hypothetical protein
VNPAFLTFDDGTDAWKDGKRQQAIEMYFYIPMHPLALQSGDFSPENG